jgi:hypothetical protein
VAEPKQLTLVERLLNEVEPGHEEHKQRVNRYDRSYDIYRATESRAPGVAPWQSKLRIPWGMHIIDTTLVNVVSGKPRVIVRPRNPEDELAAKAMQELLDYYVDEDHLVEKQPPFVQQALIYGVTAAKNHWLYRERDKPVRSFIPNPFVPDADPFVNVTRERVVERDGPSFEPWDVYDIWWDPDARDVDSASYVVLRSWLSKDQLLELRQGDDDKTGIYRNLEQLFRTGFQPEREVPRQASVLSKHESRRKDKFEIWEIWKDNRLTVVGNRKVVIRDEPNPFWHGRKPIVVCSTRPDGFEMAGIPETELVDHLQQALWTIQNMRFDNLHLTVQRGITYREGGITDPNALELRPRFKWPVQDHDDIRPFEVQSLPPEAYAEEEALLGRMQQVTGISPYISGADVASVDQNTATGVSILNEVASRILRFKASQIHWRGYVRTYEQWSELVKQFLDTDVSVRINGPGEEYTWQELGPQDVVGSYDVRLEGSEESLSRQQERAEAIQLLNVFAPLVPTGLVNVRPILEKVAMAFNIPNPETLIQPSQPQLPASPQGSLPGPPQSQGQLLQNGGQVQGPQLDPRIAEAIGGGL